MRNFFFILFVCLLSLLQVSSVNAQMVEYPNKLRGTDVLGVVAIANQGTSVAISADGNTIIVGGPNDNSRVGAVWEYTRSSSGWSTIGTKLLGSNAIGESAQGTSVALSADGKTAIIGGYGDNNAVGAAWVFTISNGVRTQQKLVGSGAVGAAYQGMSVALSADGNTAIIGGFIDNIGTGAAWVFSQSGGIWTQQGNKLVGSGTVSPSYQGMSVALSADGNIALIGGNRDNSYTGAVWAFSRSGGIWTQQGSKLVGSGAVGASQQGKSVALSADGNTIIIGGSADSSSIGAAWIFSRSGGIWTQQGSKLIGSGAVGAAYQSTSVALSTDGNTSIIGGYGDNNNVGAAWVFKRAGGIWTQQGNKLVSSSATSNAFQGTSVSISSDGNTTLIGGPGDNSGAGAAWIFTRSAGVWTQLSHKFVTSDIIGSASQGQSVSLSGDGNTALIGGSEDDGGIGATWVFTRTNRIWNQEKKLVGSHSDGNPNQGSSVALSTDGNTAIVGGYGDNRDSGAVWIFTRSRERMESGRWEPQAIKLIGTGAGKGKEAHQGFSVAISANGNAIIFGGPYDNTDPHDPEVGVGTAWVFTRSNGIWTQQGNKFVVPVDVIVDPRDPIPDRGTYGYSVALSGDGTTALLGGPTARIDSGAAYVFTLSNGVWTVQGERLVGTGATGYEHARQGSSVALSADGNTAMVGGFDDNNKVAAWIFTRSGGIWTQQGNKLIGPSGRDICSVALSADGSTAIIGGPYGVGGACIFTRYNGVWTQLGNTLVGSGAVGSAYQGCSVALSANGFTAIVGGYRDQNNEGAAWVFDILAEPSILSIADIPADQGGNVRVTWKKSELDYARDCSQIMQYGLWRRISSGGGTPSLAIRPLAKIMNDTLGNRYDFITSVPAVQSQTYNVVAPTLSDSSATGANYTQFRVTAHTSNPNIFFFSDQGSGYSVDNIPPISISGESIASLANGGILLNWQADRFDTDLKGYRIYRSTTRGFVIGESTSLAFTSDTLYTDTKAAHGLMSYYRIAAVDLHDNVGMPSTELGSTPTGVGDEEQILPKEFSLSQNYPNPFNPTTIINYQIPGVGTQYIVSLKVYDVLGREVATLINEIKPAGFYQVQWNAANIPSGVYFYRLNSGSFSETKKLILLK